MKPGKKRPPPPECPVCGAEVPPNASACPECGADERTGWNEEATRYDGLDLPEEAFGEENGRTPKAHAWGSARWTAIAVLVLAAFVYLIFRAL